MDYGRILLKMSGESLKGSLQSGISPAAVAHFATEIKSLVDAGIQVALVVGGGNIVRGTELSGAGTERATADYMGMLATVINGLALQDALEQAGIYTRLQSAIHMEQVAEPYIRRRAVRHLEKGRVVIFSAGTGNPYFSTDTAAALRACEINADAFVKGTRVDGVFTADPEKDASARRYLQLTYQEAIEKNLHLLDGPAFVMCRDNSMPIIICDATKPGRLLEVLRGKGPHTIVKDFSASVLE
ncbi:UMP kinase [bacterium]|nr:UMP kinase [bacterium]